MNKTTDQSYDELFNGELENFIKYTPTYALMCEGNFGAALLLRQIQFREKEYGIFWKFRAPCKNPHYKIGDSWLEELQCTRSQFDGALKIIGQKLKEEDSKRDPNVFVYYWEDSVKRTFYELNKEYIAQEYKRAIKQRVDIEKMMKKERKILSLPIYEKILKNSKIINHDSENQDENHIKNNKNNRIRNHDSENQKSRSTKSENMSFYNTKNTSNTTRQKDLDKSKSYASDETKDCKNKRKQKLSKIVRNSASKEKPTPASKKNYKYTSSDEMRYNTMVKAGCTKHRENTKAYFDSMDTLHALFHPRCSNPIKCYVPEEYVDFDWTLDDLEETFKFHLKHAELQGQKPIKAIGNFIYSQYGKDNRPWSPLIVWHQKMNKNYANQLTEEGRKLFNSMKHLELRGLEDLHGSIINKVARELSELEDKYVFVDGGKKRTMSYTDGLYSLMAKFIKIKLNNSTFEIVYITQDGFVKQMIASAVKKNVIKKVNGLNTKSGLETSSERERQRTELKKLKGTISDEEYKKREKKINRLFIKDGEIIYK